MPLRKRSFLGRDWALVGPALFPELHLARWLAALDARTADLRVAWARAGELKLLAYRVRSLPARRLLAAWRPSLRPPAAARVRVVSGRRVTELSAGGRASLFLPAGRTLFQVAPGVPPAQARKLLPKLPPSTQPGAR